jgi:hypothetical protein
VLDTTCTRKPALTVCTAYVTPKEYFVGIGQVFCGRGITEAGVTDASGIEDAASE